MATLTINKAKMRATNDRWITFDVEYIDIMRGKIYFVGKFRRVAADNCLIIESHEKDHNESDTSTTSGRDA